MHAYIRKGKKKDVEAALGLIRELARFEKAPREVAVSKAEMIKWGFGKEKAFDFFVLELSNEIVGIALFYYKYSTWKGKCLFLEDLIVTKKHRGKGFGKILFEEVVKVAKKEKVRRMEWQVLEWNKPAIGFYKKYNSLFDREWLNCKFTDKQLQSLHL